MNTSIEAVLYTSKTLSNGQHAIMLRLTKNRKRKYISLHISLAPQHWDAEKCKPKWNCPDRERIEGLIKLKTQELQNQVMDFKANDKEYTLNTLLDKTSHQVVKQTTGDYLNAYIDRLLAANRVGNAKTFQELRTSLTHFGHSLDFYFIDIGYISVHTTIKENADRGFIRRNTYYINQEQINYFFLDNSFFKKCYPAKIAGVLLLLKSVCLNNTDFVQ